MIACFGKNDRGAHLFAALTERDPRFVNLGTVQPARSAHLRGLVLSASPDLSQTKRDARFSPPFLAGTAAACAELTREKDVEAVLYWGATNLPIEAGAEVPYAIVTDGPFDPDDESYPVEWRPQRWGPHYLQTQREVFQKARHVFTLSEWARQKTIKVHGLSPDQVTRCGWGPLACFFPPRLESTGGTKLIVSIGSDWRRKGMDLVAEAGAKLHADDPNVHTVIAGVPGDLQLAKRPGVSLLATNTPPMVVHTLMRSAACLVISARFDASPHVIYEALQYGTPVVGTNVCGVPEAIDAPKGGAIAAAVDVPSLVDALRSVLNDDEAVRRRDAYETFVKSGGWGRAADIVLERFP